MLSGCPIPIFQSCFGTLTDGLRSWKIAGLYILVGGRSEGHLM